MNSCAGRLIQHSFRTLAITAVLLSSFEVALAQSNPGQQFADEINHGDVTSAAHWSADDMVARGGFCNPLPNQTCVGKEELLRALNHAVMIHARVTPIGSPLLESSVAGTNTISARTEIRDDYSRAANINRYISVHTSQIRADGMVALVDDQFDLTDAETARYMGYLKQHPELKALNQADSNDWWMPLGIAGLIFVAASTIVACSLISRRFRYR